MRRRRHEQVTSPLSFHLNGDKGIPENVCPTPTPQEGGGHLLNEWQVGLCRGHSFPCSKLAGEGMWRREEGNPW